MARIKTLLGNHRRYDTSQTRLFCFSGAGFTPELRSAADPGRATLVGLDVLYGS